jgi:PAS domain S-box-containing protein
LILRDPGLTFLQKGGDASMAGPGSAEARRVLVVDDDDDFRTSLADVLAGAGYLVDEAAGALDALRLLREHGAPTALVDVRLGKDSGTALVRAIHEEFPRTACVIMTAFAGPDAAVEAIRVGAYDYLAKPFETEELLAALRRCLERARLDQERDLALAAAEARAAELAAANERLVESESRYREIFDNTSDGIFVYDVTEAGEYRVASLNPANERMTGSRQAEAVGKLIQDVFPAEIVAAVKPRYDACLASGARRTYDEVLDFPAGKGAFTTTLIPVRRSGSGGRVRRIIGIVRDVTETRRIQAELREREAFYREIFDNVSDGIFVVDVTPERRYKLVSYNPAQERMIGIRARDAVGRFNDEYLPPEAAARVNEDNGRCIDAGVPMVFEQTLDLPGGQRHYQTTLVPVRDAAGRVHRLIGAARDVTEARRLEQALRKSEERFSKAFHQNPDSVTITHLDDAVILEANPGFEQVFGYAREEVVGRSGLSNGLGLWVREEDRLRLVNALRERGEVVDVVPFRRKDGAIRDGLLSWTQIEIDGAPCVLSITRDVTEGRRQEAALKASEEKFARAFFASPASSVISRVADGTLVEVNPAFERAYGYRRDEIIGRTALAAGIGIWADEADRAALVGELLATGRVDGREASFRHKDGSVRRSLVSWRTIEVDGSQCILSIAIDLTERLAMEHALRDSESRFRLLAENSTDLISRHDPRGVYLYASPACRALLGFEPGELVGRLAYELFHPDDTAAISASHMQVVEQGGPSTISYRIRRKDGSTTWFESVSRAVRDPSTGALMEIQVSSRDVSERKAAEARDLEHERQLFQAAKLVSLGTLVSGIGHEINNPNNFIRLNAQTMLELWPDMHRLLAEANDAEPGGIAIRGISFDRAEQVVEKLLRGIEEGSRRIERLIVSLRDFARGDEGDLTDLVDLGAVVRSAIMIINSLVHKATQAFTVREAPDLPRIRGNYHQLEQVVINLLTNACQALSSRQQGVSVSTSAAQATGGTIEVVLEVTDEGEGISPDVLPRITDPFFTTKSGRGGSGLGLAVSSRIVANHGGKMSFESAVGKGTVATVRLPAAGPVS